jgi:nicotinamide mononucleotide (NMN) deamidase PncC
MSAPNDIAELVDQLHASPGLAVLAVTGGGSGALAALLGQPGASRTVLEAAVPYAADALTAWLGARPEQFCSQRTACAMAMVGYQRALKYQPEQASAARFGIAATCSLASDRPKHGEHRFFVALQTASSTTCQQVVLTKGARSRADEEAVVERVILNLVAQAKGMPARLTTGLSQREPVDVAHIDAPCDWQALLAGETAAVQACGPARLDEPGILFPGAFNPLHEGHRRMAALAAQKLGQPVAFELSITNVDKPPLDFLEIRERVAQFADAPLWLTRASTFVEKAKLFPGVTFAVGADTMARIAEPRYYGDSPATVARAIDELAACGCRFLVFGRVRAGQFEGLDQLRLPAALRALCDGVAEDEFRNDVSSNALRRTRNS